MQQGWTFTINGVPVTPEEMAARQAEARQKLLDNKPCKICKNTYLINDQITMCSYSKKCVDNENGQQCEHWEPLEI